MCYITGLLRQEVEDLSKRDYVYYLAVAHTRLKVITYLLTSSYCFVL